MTPQEALQKAIDVCGGTPLKFAMNTGGKFSRQQVDYWLKQASGAPAEHCPAIEAMTRAVATQKGDASLIVTCEELRPSVAWAVLREQAA